MSRYSARWTCRVTNRDDLPRQIMFQPARHAVPPRLMADVTILLPHQRFDWFDRVVRADDALRVNTGEHRDVIVVVAGRECFRRRYAEQPAKFRQRSAFVEIHVA